MESYLFSMLALLGQLDFIVSSRSYTELWPNLPGERFEIIDGVRIRTEGFG